VALLEKVVQKIGDKLGFISAILAKNELFCEKGA
jgi:hypothetical protein